MFPYYIWRRKVQVLVTQSCSIICYHMKCGRSGFSVHGILQANILEWVVFPYSRGSSRPRDQAQFSHIWCRTSSKALEKLARQVVNKNFLTIIGWCGQIHCFLIEGVSVLICNLHCNCAKRCQSNFYFLINDYKFVLSILKSLCL